MIRDLVETERSKLLSLQVLRAVAATLVVFAHTLHEAKKLVPDDHGIVWLRDIFPFEIGVDIFFVISGFVMVWISEGRRDERGYPLTYLWARLVRIAPPYWFYTTLMVIALAVVPQFADTARLSAERAFVSYVFFPGWDEPVRPLLSLGWTLNYEAFFYVYFFACLLVLRRYAVYGLLVTFPLLVLLRPLLPETGAALQFWTGPIILEFCYGAVIAMAVRRGVVLPRGVAVLMALSAVVAMVLLAPMLTYGNRPFVYGLPSALLIAALALVPGWQRGAGVSTDTMRVLGASSYTLYLAHPFVITVLIVLWMKLGIDAWLSPWAYVALTVLMSLAWSVVGYLAIERPLIAVAKRGTTRSRKRRPLDTPTPTGAVGAKRL
ncbi:MAG: acyltransferase [Pseudomonadota bacterium]